ncbi:hypothetical protein GmHk_16G046104 [Glycine max]|nr:hypothetical protein GmHk_16G046104 [Glycine max]KAH1205387.1 hypothetical protein GmHk_16G046104 [Glycine max]KAH1205388.1 hypothetical protein GmHk_16G046104 [Glycine max]
MGLVLSDTPRSLMGGCAEKSTAHPEAKHGPHVLSRGGYDYLEQKLMAEKTKKKLEEAAQSGSTEGVINPSSPIRGHVKWKMTRTKKTGQMKSEAAKEIADKIDSLEEQMSQGSFVPHGRQDVLTTSIGRPKHPGHVPAAGASVTIKQYFRSAPQSSRSSSSIPPEELEKLTQQIRDRLKESITEKGLALPSKHEVAPSAARVSTKGSCVDPSLTDPKTSDSDKCGLYIEENPSYLVTLGRLYEGSTVAHNIPLLHGQVKVGVEEVKGAQAPVPVPLRGLTSGAGTEHLPCLADTSYEACIRTIFLNNNRHLTRTSMRAGNSDAYGFLEPQSIQRSGQSQFESKCYIKSWMQSSKRDVYLGAYLNGGHWQMVVIMPKENLVVWFCSLHNKPDNYLKGIIYSALKGLDDTPQPKSKAVLGGLLLRQKGSIECDYYVMHWMSMIILRTFRNNWYFNDIISLEAERLKALRIQWRKFYLKVRNES